MSEANPTTDERLERQAVESKQDASALSRAFCEACKGSGVVMARVQYTDRSRPCEDRQVPCPICQDPAQHQQGSIIRGLANGK
jgi:hypothetical protein